MEFFIIESLVVFKHPPDGMQQFTHHGYIGKFLRLPAFNQALFKIHHSRLKLRGHHSRYEERLPQVFVTPFADSSFNVNRFT